MTTNRHQSLNINFLTSPVAIVPTSRSLSTSTKLVQQSQREPTISLMLASSAKTTWLEDIMRTWKFDAVQDSGVLETSKDVQEISRYPQSLEHEAERDAEIEWIQNASHYAQNPDALTRPSQPTASTPSPSPPPQRVPWKYIDRKPLQNGGQSFQVKLELVYPSRPKKNQHLFMIPYPWIECVT